MQLIEDLKKLGVWKGDTVLMHSSFKSLGGGIDAKTFFEAFIDLLGEKGTLILPSLSYEYVTAAQPVFHRRNTPSCIGYLPEYFRTSVAGVRRSLHATHSCCAIGANAARITEHHELDVTPVGRNSPFAKLPQIEGKILLLGSPADSNTSLHGVEETVFPEYVLDFGHRVEYRLQDDDGTEMIVPSIRHLFHTDKVDYIQKYSRITNLLSDDELRRGRVLNASCLLMDAKAVWRKGHDAMLKDPLYFVDRRYK